MTRTLFSRRRLLQLGAGTAFAGFIPRLSSAAGTRDPRFMTIVLRGALDGLTAVPPVGDPSYNHLRGDLAHKVGTPVPLSDMFGLHPAMPNLARQYRAGQALIVHASASPYRDRSHFDGQDVLESGQPGPGHKDSGWLNRLLLTQGSGQKIAPDRGLAIGAITPLILRGQADCLGWTPSTQPLRDDALPGRVMALYKASDPKLADICATALRSQAIAGAAGDNAKGKADLMVAMAQGAARMMARDDGPRIGAMAIEGWDTHSSEISILEKQLSGLDRALGAYEQTLGPVWNDTAILVITEFGRTAAINGTNGTDHGTGTVAFLTGGAVKGGRVIADWPGLKTNQLYQARDLAPTTDIRAVAKGVMQGLFDTPVSIMGQDIFPESAGVAPMRDLIA
ncbi:DUF1501 domain-containing protein [Asticcacaulis sp.]|uniref:DUF1501 domain-containing protein n=1 Tax=Asticcacaulis sp. TaxID=1872648 RepID=UPI003F7B7AA5